MPCILVKHQCSEGLLPSSGYKTGRGEMFRIEGKWNRQAARFLEVLVFIYQINGVIFHRTAILKLTALRRLNLINCNLTFQYVDSYVPKIHVINEFWCSVLKN
jgi:hypothetical protein